MKLFLTVFVACLFSIVLNLDGTEYKVDFQKLVMGANAPKLVDSNFIFSSNEKNATCAKIEDTFDFSKGGSIALEFEDSEIQSNPYPRLLESGKISIQLLTDNGKSKAIKLMITSDDKNLPPLQNIVPFKHIPDKKRTLLATLDIPNQIITFKLDGNIENKFILKDAVKGLDKVNFILGASSLNNSNRGFNGKISNLVITTPLEKIDNIVSENKDPAIALDANLAKATVKVIEPRDLQNGEKAPNYNQDGIFFDVKNNSISSAAIKEKLDFSKGVKLEFEFLDGGAQNNLYPRLFEADKFSIHLVAEAKKADDIETDKYAFDKGIKILIKGEGKEEYSQIVLPLAYNKGKWHKLIATIEPKRSLFSLAIDDKKEELLLRSTTNNLQNLSVILGNSTLKENSNRGFNGAIRNIKITTPYDPQGKSLKIDTSKKLTINGVEVEHFTINAIKNRHAAFPGVAKLANGDLAVVFREGEEHVCPYGRICITFSKDNGKSWSAPVAIADTPSDERDPSIQVLDNGRVLVTYNCWHSWMYYKNLTEKYHNESSFMNQVGKDKFAGSHYIFSDDNGESWSKPVKVPAFSPHGPLYYNGEFYQPSLASRDGKRFVDMYKGSSDAKNWEKIGIVGESELGNIITSVVYEEPHTAILPDKTMVTAIRVPSDGYMRIAISKDLGKSHSEVIKTNVRGFPQHLLPLKDGRLLATYGYRYFPYGIRACISSDGGKTWDMANEFVIQNNGLNIDLGYPVSIELDNGKIMTVYYHITQEKPTCFIEGAIWSIK